MAASKGLTPSTPEVSRRMRRVRQKNTSAESAIRRALHAYGLRYRIHVIVSTNPRRVADIALSGLRIAVFVDGCFWHGCPLHGSWPKENADFWRAKIIANQARDQDTDERLRADGWKVVRVWAHEAPTQAAAKIARVIKRRKTRSRV